MVLKDCEQCLVYGTDNRPLAKARAEVMDDDRVLQYTCTGVCGFL